MNSARQFYWQSQLRPIRLGAEPVADQIRRRMLVNAAGSVCVALIGLIFLGIFAAFGRSDLGLIIAGTLFAVGIVGNWIVYFRLRRRMRAYLVELEGDENDNAPPG